MPRHNLWPNTYAFVHPHDYLTVLFKQYECQPDSMNRGLNCRSDDVRVDIHIA